ncbi:MAG: hypothetical protein GY749_02720 [Desulfobacteraceae bacterium]|nr:hypothetical protein [Desulfobacteraceae bacterium]
MIGFTEAALNGSDALTYFAIFHESGHAAVGLECRKQMIACPQPVDNPTIMQHECWADLCAAAVLKKHVKVMAATIKNEHVSIANSLGYGDQQHLSGTRRMKAVKKIIDDLNWVVLHK